MMDKNTYIFFALTYWANYIESGNWLLSRGDAIKQNKKVPELNVEQIKQIEHIRGLAQKAIDGKISIKE